MKLTIFLAIAAVSIGCYQPVFCSDLSEFNDGTATKNRQSQPTNLKSSPPSQPEKSWELEKQAYRRALLQYAPFGTGPDTGAYFIALSYLLKKINNPIPK